MPELTPTQAAQIAEHVYGIRQEMDIPLSVLRFSRLELNDSFKLAATDRFKGQTGGHFFKSRTGIGYAIAGVGNRSDEALIALRGTDILADWLTDANVSLQRGPSGSMVHGGFNHAFKSISTEIGNFLRTQKPRHVHCVGHSLGGALATLTADYINALGLGGVSLYTFGSPRVGTSSFCRDFTKRVKKEHIHRTFHTSDGVSMVPIFPFQHVPDGGGHELFFPSSVISVAPHSMKNYINSVRGAGWGSLPSASTESSLERQIGQLLEAGSGQGVFMHSYNLLKMINTAILWVLKKAGLALVGAGFTSGATILDRLAWLLHQGCLMSKATAGHVATIMQWILQFTGRGVTTGIDVGQSFIRWMLELLYGTLRSLVKRVLS